MSEYQWYELVAIDRPLTKEQMAELRAISTRAEILRGDLRVAYLAWLLAVQSYAVGDQGEEPPVPPGLTDLTGAQQAMVDFLRIDEDLLSAAREQSSAVPDDKAELRRGSPA